MMKTYIKTKNNNQKYKDKYTCFQQKNIQKDIKKVKNIIFGKQIILDLFIFISLLKGCQLPNIIIKIRGEGNKNIFTPFEGFNSELYPDNIYINDDEKLNEINNQYFLDEEENIIKLTWTNNINNINYLFMDCYDIREIDMSDFDFSEITNMDSLFSNCISLTSIIFPNNIISNIQTMKKMFYNCSSLLSIDLSKFDTSNTEDMSYMFYFCVSMYSIDLSNFDTSQVITMESMFEGCMHLEYINIINFSNENLENINNIFKDIPDNIVFCKNNPDNIKSKLYEKSCPAQNCQENWKANQMKIVDFMFSGCQNSACSNMYSILREYNGKCISPCPAGTLPDNEEICKCELNKCLECPPIALYKGLCSICNTGYYKKENDPLNLGNYFNCYKDQPIGYYLDETDSIYKKCYFSCETCDMKGDNNVHNCLKCKEDFPFEIAKNDYLNCYKNQEESDTQNIIGHNNFDEILKIIKNIKSDGIKEEVQFYDSILNNIEKIFTHNYDMSKLDNGEDESTQIDKITITLTTTENQKANINKNLTIIDLGECETLLRENYNAYNKTLYIKKLDIIQFGMKIPKIEYDVYCFLNNTNLEKLNISICEKSMITILIPIMISKLENIDYLNISSKYYNDICYITAPYSRTDMILKDRRNEFIEKNRTICQYNCIFSEYNYSSHKAKCLCKVEESSASFSEMKMNSKNLLQAFTDIKKISNINIISCYKTLFCKSGVINNIAFYILIVIILLHIINIFIYFKIEIKKLFKTIEDLVFSKANIKLAKINNILNESIKVKEMPINLIRSLRNNNNNLIFIDINNNKSNNKENLYKSKDVISNNIRDNNTEKKIERKNAALKIKKDKNFKTIMDYTDDELNDLDYELALKYDKRNCLELYLSLLKTNNDIIYTFFYNKDYNTRIIKIDIFLIEFTIEYTINALFFDEDSMHKIYVDEGSFNFYYQLPPIIYSYLISLCINFLLKLLAFSNDAISNFKEEISKKNFKCKLMKLRKLLRIKIILYFVLSTIFLLFFWYYLSMFGAVYRNTQDHLLKDTLISFILSFLFPFAINLLPGLCRIPALSHQKSEKCLYNMSKFINIF